MLVHKICLDLEGGVQHRYFEMLGHAPLHIFEGFRRVAINEATVFNDDMRRDDR